MARKSKTKEEPEAESDETSAKEAGATSNPGEAGDPQGEETELEQVIREREEFMRSWQRAQADFKNLKRRTLSDIDAAVRRSQHALLDDMLLVLDNLDMALTTPCTTDEAKNLLVGVEMTRTQMMTVLSREGVEPIDSSGTFDPALHQAVDTVETDEIAPGQILETVKNGWTHRGNVLRYAHVKVAADPSKSGGEASVESAEASADNED